MSYVSGIIHTTQGFIDGILGKSILSGIISFVIYSIGYDVEIIKMLAYLLLIDWVLGSALALKRRKFVSWGMIRTGYKMLLYLLILVASHQAMKNMFFPDWFDDFIEFLIIITEMKSILENSALLGFKIARRLETMLNQFVEEKFNKLI
jgi:phage-related holin